MKNTILLLTYVSQTKLKKKCDSWTIFVSDCFALLNKNEIIAMEK